MRINSRHLALVAVVAGAAAPTAAMAGTDLNPPPRDSGSVPACTKNYSLDSVTGGYCPADGTNLNADSVPAPTPPSLTTVVKHDDGGFSWSDAGAGAGGAIALIAVAAGGTIAFRRRSPSVDPRRSAAAS
jgi:hypothetical protein